MTILQRFVVGFIFSVFLSGGVLGQPATEGTLDVLDLNVVPAVLFEGRGFEIVFSGYNIIDDSFVEIDLDENLISISRFYLCFSAGNPPYPANDTASIVKIPIEGLPAGSYRVEAEWGPDCFNDTTSIARNITVYPNDPDSDLRFFHESPRDGDLVSGVNVIRGWACYPKDRGEIGKITYTVDNRDFHFSLPHGSVRQDTMEVCGGYEGDVNQPVYSGYGGVVFWPTQGSQDSHTITIYIDDEEMETVSFNVANPPPTEVPEDVGFRKGAEGEYVVESFLGTDETVIIRWSEADQNFIIVEYD